MSNYNKEELNFMILMENLKTVKARTIQRIVRQNFNRLAQDHLSRERRRYLTYLTFNILPLIPAQDRRAAKLMKNFLLEYSRKYEIKIKIVQHHDKVAAMQSKFKANFQNMDKRYQIIEEAI